jgi:hypothetical protein
MSCGRSMPKNNSMMATAKTIEIMTLFMVSIVIDDDRISRLPTF